VIGAFDPIATPNLSLSVAAQPSERQTSSISLSRFSRLIAPCVDRSHLNDVFKLPLQHWLENRALANTEDTLLSTSSFRPFL